MYRLGLVLCCVSLAACSVDDAPLQDLKFLRDPASGMCMPVMAGGEESRYQAWDACVNPCAGLDEQACGADPRCTARTDDDKRFQGCDPHPQEDDFCLGLDEQACGGTPGCQPVYGGEPCKCPDPSAGVMCACPDAAVFRGCSLAPPPPEACTSNDQCGPGMRCTVADGVCLPPPGCDPSGNMACAALCTGVCVKIDDPPPGLCGGLDEVSCRAKSGCEPVYGGVPCACDSNMGCACPAIATYLGCKESAGGTCVSSMECGPGSHCSVEDGVCEKPSSCGDPNGGCPTVCAGRCVPDDPMRGCFEIGDERTCLSRPECEAVYAGSRCYCDDKGCGCLDYTFDSCRPRWTPPPRCAADVLFDASGAWSASDGPGGAVDRIYRFDAGGTFKVEDLVAPCPPDSACVWSGIIQNHGRWSFVPPSALVLTYDEPLQQFDGLRFPTKLAVEMCGDVLIEPETSRTFARLPAMH